MNTLKIKRWNPIIILFIYVILTMCMLFVYKRNYIWNGDDIYYNFQRIIGISSNWLDGIIAPNISLTTFGKIGYGVNIFYPWLTLIPFHLISLFVTNSINSYYYALATYFLCSFLISHYSMKAITNSNKTAIVFSLIYNFSTYRLIQLFSRASLGEYIATIFLPLCFLGFYNIFWGKEDRWQSLALGMSLVIYTHVLTTFMCLLAFITILIMFCGKIEFNKNKALSLLKAIVSTIFATLIFTLPFISEELYQKYGIPDPQILKGFPLSQLLISSLDNSSNRMVNNNTYNIGFLILLSIVLGAIAIKKSDGLFKRIYSLLLLTFFLTTNLFFWNLFQNTPIKVIQYPFRLLIFTTLFGAFIFAESLKIIFKNPFNYHFPQLLLITIVLSLGLWSTSIQNTKGSLLTNKNLVVTNRMINKNLIPDTYLEQYVPIKAQNKMSSLTRHALIIDGKRTYQEPLIEGKSNTFNVRNIKKGSRIILPMIRYKYTKVYLNRRVINLPKKSSGIISFRSPLKSNNAKVNVIYKNNRLFTVITMLSYLGFVYMFISKLLYFKKEQKKE